MATFFRVIKTNCLKCNFLFRSIKPRYSTTLLQNASSQTSGTASNPLILTDACVKQLKNVMQPGEHLRVVVEGGGCSGFQYKFDVETKTNEDDSVFEKDGATVVVDNDSLEFIKGSKIDYQEELIKSSFVVVDNPLAEEGCSCGSSFNVKL